MTDQLVRPTTDRHPGDRFDDIMARIGELDPLLREEAEAGEAAGRLTPRVAEALQEPAPRAPSRSEAPRSSPARSPSSRCSRAWPAVAERGGEDLSRTVLK